MIECSQDSARRAAALPILMCHGEGDDVVVHQHGEKSADVLRSNGFQSLTFKSYNGLGHYTVPEEMDDVCKWLNTFWWWKATSNGTFSSKSIWDVGLHQVKG